MLNSAKQPKAEQTLLSDNNTLTDAEQCAPDDHQGARDQSHLVPGVGGGQHHLADLDVHMRRQETAKAVGWDLIGALLGVAKAGTVPLCCSVVANAVFPGASLMVATPTIWACKPCLQPVAASAKGEAGMGSTAERCQTTDEACASLASQAVTCSGWDAASVTLAVVPVARVAHLPLQPSAARRQRTCEAPSVTLSVRLSSCTIAGLQAATVGVQEVCRCGAVWTVQHLAL